MLMKKILIATHNKAKLEELKFGLKNLKKLGVRIVSLNDLRIQKKPKETGKTFQENAGLKARFYGELTKLPTIADDGGLMIPYLNNEPGVKSRRWLGYEATDEKLINYTLVHLKGVQKVDRTAYLQTCVCFYSPSPTVILSGAKNPAKRNLRSLSSLDPSVVPLPQDDTTIIFEQEKIRGYIAEKPSLRRINGYPFRALFKVAKFNKYYDELIDEEHQQVNHRLIALKRLVKRVKKYLIE